MLVFVGLKHGNELIFRPIDDCRHPGSHLPGFLMAGDAFGRQVLAERLVADGRAVFTPVTSGVIGGLDIEVDGGIKASTVGEVAAAGANVFVAGTAVFGAPDYRAAITGIRRKPPIDWSRGDDIPF